jgi:hypothetical protein
MTTSTAASVLSGDAATPAADIATPAGGSEQPAWYASHPNEAIRSWAENKGWADPNAALESSYNLEKLIGFDKAGRTLVVPKEDATPEERSAFFRKLGAPDKPDGYKLPEAMASDPLAAKFREVAHKNGMLPKQFEETLGWYFSEVKTMQEQRQRERTVQGEQDLAALTGEWGKAFDQNIELARRAARSFLPAKNADERSQMLTAIEDAVGTGAMMRFFAKVGEGLGEHPMHSSGDSGSFDALTPGQAKARIEALKSDKEWAAAYLNGDASKRSEMERLIRFAFPSPSE